MQGFEGTHGIESVKNETWPGVVAAWMMGLHKMGECADRQGGGGEVGGMHALRLKSLERSLGLFEKRLEDPGPVTEWWRGSSASDRACNQQHGDGFDRCRTKQPGRGTSISR